MASRGFLATARLSCTSGKWQASVITNCSGRGLTGIVLLLKGGQRSDLYHYVFGRTLCLFIRGVDFVYKKSDIYVFDYLKAIALWYVIVTYLVIMLPQ